MTDKQLLRTVKSFRKGVLEGRKVKSMCFVVCWPLHAFLNQCGLQCSLLKVGIFQNMELHSHYCIQLKDGRILDATARQFKNPDGVQMPDIYLGERPTWYQKIRNSKHSEVEKGRKRLRIKLPI